MPIHRRLPKRGFNNLFAKDYNEVNIGRLQAAVDKKTLDPKKPVTVDALRDAGVIRRVKDGVRLLGQGELKTKLNIEVTGASAGAVKSVEKAGGSVYDCCVAETCPEAEACGRQGESRRLRPGSRRSRTTRKPQLQKRSHPRNHRARQRAAKTAAKKPAKSSAKSSSKTTTKKDS